MIALSDILEIAYFRRPDGATILAKLRFKIAKSPKSVKKFVRTTSYT